MVRISLVELSVQRAYPTIQLMKCSIFKQLITYPLMKGLDGMIWVTRPPRSLPPISNILLIFDSNSWAMTLIFFISVTLVMIIITRVGVIYGGKNIHIMDIIFTGFRLRIQ